jgi:uroporphyrinogen decarboxylase
MFGCSCAVVARPLFQPTQIDILCFYGDVGDQHSMFMSPKLWRMWIKPRWGRIFASVRRINPNVFILYHSCGYIEPIIPDLIELGVSVLNPVQPEAMNPIQIKHKYGEGIALWGGVGMQQTMLSSTTEVVRRIVRRLVAEWGKGSGGIVTVTQTVLPDVPWQNVVALLESVCGRPA